MRIDIVTIFPEMFPGPLGSGLLRQAQDRGLLEIHVHDLRRFTDDKHRSVDDRPFGGGAGMVMMPEPWFRAVEAVETMDEGPVERILLTPQGAPFSQAAARELAGRERLLLMCGRYEGFDERIRLGLAPREVSIGDYVLMGGELPALVVTEAVARLLPGVVGDADSIEFESFQHGLLDYPQYTRPEEFRGMRVPEVLRSGNHARIAAWRDEQARLRTRLRRPDLLPGEDAERHGKEEP